MVDIVNKVLPHKFLLSNGYCSSEPASEDYIDSHLSKLCDSLAVSLVVIRLSSCPLTSPQELKLMAND